MSEKPINERVAALEVQVSRIVSDIESEKGTRARVNADHEDRLRNIEKSVYKAAGAVGLILALLEVVLRFSGH